MSVDDVKGITLNTRTISYIMGLVGLASVFWYAVSYLQGQEFRSTAIETRLTTLEQRQANDQRESKEDLKNILVKIDVLSTKVTELTIALNGVQVRQEGQK